jgi:hypothetical protein
MLIQLDHNKTRYQVDIVIQVTNVLVQDPLVSMLFKLLLLGPSTSTRLFSLLIHGSIT